MLNFIVFFPILGPVACHNCGDEDSTKQGAFGLAHSPTTPAVHWKTLMMLMLTMVVLMMVVIKPPSSLGDNALLVKRVNGV